MTVEVTSNEGDAAYSSTVTVEGAANTVIVGYNDAASGGNEVTVIGRENEVEAYVESTVTVTGD